MLFSPPLGRQVPARPRPDGITLITGAAGGIGRALAEALAERKHELLLVDRNEGPLRDLCDSIARKHGTRAIPLAQDLAAADGAQRVFDFTRENDLKIATLINNAAVGVHAPIEEQSPRRVEEMVHVNVLSVVNLTHFFLPLMRQRGGGTIVNVSSSGVYERCPWWSVYAATKAFVLHFTESLQQEVADSGVQIVAVCPGMTSTQFFEKAGTQTPDHDIQTPEEVVAETLAGLDRGRPLIVTGWSNRVRVHTERASLRRLLSGLKRGLRRVAMLS